MRDYNRLPSPLSTHAPVAGGVRAWRTLDCERVGERLRMSYNVPAQSNLPPAERKTDGLGAAVETIRLWLAPD